MYNRLNQHPFLLACFPLMAAWLLISMLVPQGLHNDDYQIWFMYCNGGTGSIPFSFYSGAIEGYLFMALNAISPQLNWYLILLRIIASAASLALNYHASSCWCQTTPSARGFDIAKLFALLSILTYINFQCVYFSQYTNIAMLCACSSLFLAFDWWQGHGGRMRISASLALLFCAFELRAQSLAAFLILGMSVAAVAILTRRERLKQRSKWSLALFPLLIAGLAAADYLTFQSVSEWSEARHFCKIRMGIQDSRDNSGVDKSDALQAAGITKAEFSRFQSFTYIPDFCHEKPEELQRLCQIHQSHRRGFLSSDVAASFGILSTEGYQFKGGDTLLRAITPWVPIIIGLGFLLFGPNRRAMKYALPMILSVLLYFGILILLQRAVGRVLHPVLYAGGIWILASPTKENILTRNKLSCYGLILMSTISTLFCLREIRWFFSPNPPAWQYCTQNPQNLYLTTSMQHLNIFPPGCSGVSLHFFANTNVIPIADGWCFYSPAYKKALKARGISNPYAELCKPNTYLVTQNNIGEDGTLRLISAVHNRQVGTELQFEKVETVGKFTFWKAKQQP